MVLLAKICKHPVLVIAETYIDISVDKNCTCPQKLPNAEFIKKESSARY